MSQKTKNILLQALPVITIATLLVVALISAWQEPTAPPPGGNVPAPLNIGPVTQWKSGALGLGYSTPPFTLGSGEIAATTFRDANNSTYFIDPSGAISAILSGNVGIGTTTTPGAKLDVQGGDIKVGATTIKSDGSVIFNPQTTPPSNPVRGQIYFDADSNLMKYYDGAAWRFMDRGYLAGLIGYSGATHTRQHCVDAGGTVTEISGDGTNTEVCKFSKSSCPSGWERAGNWHTRTASTNPNCNTGGDVCGNNKITCCTVNASDWSNSAPICTYYSYGGVSGYDYQTGTCFGMQPTSGCTVGRWCFCYMVTLYDQRLYCVEIVSTQNEYTAFASTAITEIGCK